MLSAHWKEEFCCCMFVPSLSEQQKKNKTEIENDISPPTKCWWVRVFSCFAREKFKDWRDKRTWARLESFEFNFSCSNFPLRSGYNFAKLFFFRCAKLSFSLSLCTLWLSAGRQTQGVSGGVKQLSVAVFSEIAICVRWWTMEVSR